MTIGAHARFTLRCAWPAWFSSCLISRLFFSSKDVSVCQSQSTVAPRNEDPVAIVLFTPIAPLTDYSSIVFVRADDDGQDHHLECAICTNIAFHPPNLESCEHLCRECLVAAHKLAPADGRNQCATCRTSHVASRLAPNKFAQAMIEQLRFTCSRAVDGCQAVPEVLGVDTRNWLQHERVCGFVIGKCQACRFPVRRNQVADHLQNQCKPSRCVHCQMWVPEVQLASHTSADGSLCVNTQACGISELCKVAVVRGYAGVIAHASVCKHRPFCGACRQSVSGSKDDHALVCALARGDDTCAICHHLFSKECILCEAAFADKDKCAVSRGECGHVYHKHCIDRWLRTRDTCPLDDEPWAFVLV